MKVIKPLFLAILFGAVAAPFYLFLAGNTPSRPPLIIDHVSTESGAGSGELLLTLKGSGLSKSTRVFLEPDSVNQSAVVAKISAVQRLETIVLERNRALLADNQNGLHLADFTDPLNPVILGSLREGFENVWDVAPAGDIAYIADPNIGVMAVDMSIPQELKILSTLSGPARPFGVTSRGTTLSVAGGEAGVHFFDISRPESPKPSGFVETPGFAWNVAVEGNFAYVADGDGGVHLIDLAAPGGPYLRSSCQTNGKVRDVTVRNDVVYAALDRGGMQVIDWRLPDQPFSSAPISLPGTVIQARTDDNFLYLAAGQGGVIIFDVTLPLQPKIAGLIRVEGNIRCLVLKDDYLIAGGMRKGLAVIDLRKVSSAHSFPDVPGVVESIAVADGQAFVAGGGFSMYDISAPLSPSFVDNISVEYHLSQLAVTGRVGYLAAFGQGLKILSLKQGISPLGEFIPGGAVKNVAVKDSLLFFSEQGRGVHIAEIQDPANPRLLATFPCDSAIRHIQPVGSLLYLATVDSGLVVIDLADPAAPKMTHRLPLVHDLRKVQVRDDLGVVTSSGGDLFILDLTDPRRPQLQASLKESGRCSDMVFWKNRLLTLNHADSPRGPAFIRVYDLTGPSSLTLIQHLMLGGRPTELVARPDRVFFVDGSKKLFSLQLSENGRFAEISKAPLGIMGEILTSDEKYLYMAQRGSQLRIVDVSNPDIPRLKAQGPGWIRNVSEFGRYLVTYGGISDVNVYDITNPVRPIHLARISPKGMVERAVIENNRLYLTDSLAGLRVFSLSRNGQAAELAAVPFDSSATGLIVRDGVAFLSAGKQGMYIIDLKNTLAPRMLSHLSFPWPRRHFTFAMGVALHGEVALLANGWEGLLTIDVSDTKNPRAIGHLPLGLATQVKVFGNRAYVVSDQSHLWVVDLSDPAFPRKAGHVVAHGRILDFDIKDNLIYLAQGESGIGIFELPVNLQAVSAEKDRKLILRLPRPRIPGTYRLEIDNRFERTVVENALSF